MFEMIKIRRVGFMYQLFVAAVFGVLFTTSVQAQPSWITNPEKNKLKVAVMMWVAAKNCPDFPVSSEKADKYIYTVAKKENKTGRVKGLKENMAPKIKGAINGFMGSRICAKAGGKARELVK